MTRIVCVGAPTFDTIFRVAAIPATPTKVLAEDAVQVTGGMAASAGAAILRLGGEVAYWGRIGQDETGRRIRDDLAALGMDVTALRCIRGGRSTVSAVLVDRSGERLVCPFYDPSLDPDPGWLPLDRLGGADAVLVDPRWPDGAASALAAARGRGLPGVLDADLSPRDVLDRLVPLASHAVFSAPGLRDYCGTADIGAGLALAAAAGAGAGMVGVTAGPRGFFWLDEGRLRQAPAPVVAVVDTLSAGDVFHGAFTLALAEGMSLDAAAHFANGAAALKCTRFGGRSGTPDRAELQRFLAGPSR